MKVCNIHLLEHNSASSSCAGAQCATYLCPSVIHLWFMSVSACVSPDDRLPAASCPEHSNGVFLVRGSEPCVSDFKTHMVSMCVFVLYLEIFQCDFKVIRGDLVVFYLMLFSSVTPLHHISLLDTWFETKGVHSNPCLCKHCTMCVWGPVCSQSWCAQIHCIIHWCCYTAKGPLITVHSR